MPSPDAPFTRRKKRGARKPSKFAGANNGRQEAKRRKTKSLTKDFVDEVIRENFIDDDWRQIDVTQEIAEALRKAAEEEDEEMNGNAVAGPSNTIT